MSSNPNQKLIDLLLSQEHEVLYSVFTKIDLEDLFGVELSGDEWADCVRSYRNYDEHEAYSQEALSWCMPAGVIERSSGGGE